MADWRANPRGLTMPEAVSVWADLVRYLRATKGWSQRRAGEEFGIAELAVRKWERDGVLPRVGLIARHMANLVKDAFTKDEVVALSKGAYLDPPKKIPHKEKGRKKTRKKR